MPTPILEVRHIGDIQAGRPMPAGARLRVAHLTDIHVGAVPGSVDGFAAALASLRSLDPLPDCLVLGGDMIEDGFGGEGDAWNQLSKLAEEQWRLFDSTLLANLPTNGGIPIPVYPILGNHDVFAWGLPGPPLGWRETKEKALRHLGQFSDHLARDRTFYSVLHGGWRLIFLDSITGRGADPPLNQPGGSFYGGFDGGIPMGEQAAWLQSELATTGQHLAVFSHIPVLSSTPLFWNDYPINSPNVTIDYFGGSFPRPNSFWAVQDHTIMHFMRNLVGEFALAGVQLCAAGHTHMLDWVTHRGILFACSGAVSGNYWKGPCADGTKNGYVVFDLWENGWKEASYYSFGW